MMRSRFLMWHCVYAWRGQTLEQYESTDPQLWRLIVGADEQREGFDDEPAMLVASQWPRATK